MKIYYKFSLIFSFSLAVFVDQVFSQYELSSTPSDKGKYFNENSRNLEPRTDKIVPRITKERIITNDEISIKNEMNAMRHSGNLSTSKYMELQRQLDKITGQTITKTPEPFPIEIIVNKNPPSIKDNIIATEICNDPNIVVGTAVKMFQKGPHTGELWAACAEFISSRDIIVFYNSLDGGYHWSNIFNVALGNNYHFNNDELDMEIISDNVSNQYYVYVVAGVSNNLEYYHRIILFVLTTIPTPQANAYLLSWPGSTIYFYNCFCPRISSDNATYNFNNNVMMHIICSLDSTVGAYHSFEQKYAFISQANTITPTITYLGPKYFWYCNNLNYYFRYLYSDIAYFTHEGVDSIIVSFSGLPDSTGIYYAKSDEFGNAVNGGYDIIGNESVYKYGARIATDESGNGNIITVFKEQGGYYTAGFKYFRSTTYDYLGNYYQIAPIGSDTVLIPDVVGRRGSDNFNIAYQYNSTVDYLHYVTVDFNGSWIRDAIVNPTGLMLTGSISPKAGFRNVPGDSCLVIYDETGPYHLWVSNGCSGNVVVGKQSDKQMASSFGLEQNYPNPFNPSTEIEFSIPKSGLVMLFVYNVLGEEVETLLNEVKEAGNYNVSFNGAELPSGVYFYKLTSGNYINTKKMLMIK